MDTETITKPEDTGTQAKTLDAALLDAQRTVGVAAKEGQNSHGGYNYSSREVIVGHAKAALIEAGLFFTFLGPIEADESTATWQASLHHPQTGQTRSWLVKWTIHYAMKGMTFEQRVGTAQSYAEKYQLLSLLQIPRGGDELDGMAHRGERQEQPKLTPEQEERREFWGLLGEDDNHTAVVAKYAEANGLKGKSRGEWSMDDIRKARQQIEAEYPV